MRIGELAKNANVDVRWRPFNVRPLMRENNVALSTQKAKVKYMWRDIERRAAHHKLEFVKAPIWPTDPELLANCVGIVASEGGWGESYTVASFKAWFLDGLPLGTRASLEHILKPLKQDVDKVIARAESAVIVEKYNQETDIARSLGIFGSPSFIVDGELFWGDDRLEEAIKWAASTHELQNVKTASALASVR